MSIPRKSFFAVLALLALAPRAGYGDKGIVLVGPMLHLQFGEHGHYLGYGLEASYWNFLGGVWPYGVDVGAEFGHGHFRIYSEAQASLVVTGFSMGPVLEIGGEHGTNLGWQNTLWAAYVLGLDMRWRFANGKTDHDPGVFLKFPALYDASEWDLDENHSHHHHHDWFD
jgi:hypothetical protein